MGVTFGTLIGCVLALAIAVGIYLLQTNVVMLPDNDTFTYASLNGMVYGALAGLAFGFLETWRQNSPSAH